MDANGNSSRVYPAFGDVRLPRRFWSKVQPCPMSGCWIWIAGTAKSYGRFRIKGSNARRAHRIAYECLSGPIPSQLVLDHRCRVPSCVNPAHLEPVTDRENILRGTGVAALNAAKTTCHRGHAYSCQSPEGYRVCRVCKASTARLRYAAEKENHGKQR